MLFALTLFFTGAEFGAFGKIREALESQEASGSVFLGRDDFIGGFQDRIVDLFREVGAFAIDDGVELDDANLLARGDSLIDSVEGVLFGVKKFERLARDPGKSEAFGSWFANTIENDFVGVAPEPLGDLIDFLFSEVFKCTLFSHKSEGEKGEIRHLRKKFVRIANLSRLKRE